MVQNDRITVSVGRASTLVHFCLKVIYMLIYMYESFSRSADLDNSVLAIIMCERFLEE